MNQIVFLLLVVVHLGFIYKITDKLPTECQAFAARLTALLPRFEDPRADMKSFGFLFTSMVFVVAIFVVIFG